MASDSLISVIGGLIRRENRMAREEKAKIKAAEAEDAEAEEEDEDEAPVGDQDSPEEEPEEEPELKAEQEPEDEEEPEPEPEEDPEEEEPNPEGDTKPSGPDPTLVAQVARIVKQQIEDEKEEESQDKVKLSGKKEKIDTKPKLEQQEVREGKMNFKEAIRLSVTGTALAEGYEEVVLGILEDAKIDGPLGYEPFFEKGKLFVEKGSEKKAAKVLKQSRDINKIPKIVGEELDPEEYLTMESVAVDGRMKGFKEALRRLTYEKIKKLGISKEGAAEFMAAASAAKKEGKKKFKFGGKEYPVTIKVDIPLKGEQKEEKEEIELLVMFNEVYKDLDKNEQVEFRGLLEQMEDDEVFEGLADYFTSAGRGRKKLAKMQAKIAKIKDKEEQDKQIAKAKADLDQLKKDNPSMLTKLGKGLKKFFGTSDPTPDELAKEKEKKKDDGEGDPPKADPPAGDPPKGDPPAGDPPKGDPPAGDPPKGDPPEDESPDDYKKRTGSAPPGYETVDGKVVKKQESLKKTIGRVVNNESNELQAIMALDDEGISAEINRKGQVVVKKKDLKKAEKALKKSFRKGGEPKLVGEQRTAYEVVSEARTKVATNKPEWETEDSRLS